MPNERNNKDYNQIDLSLEDEFLEIDDEEKLSDQELEELVFYSIKTGNPTTVESISNLDNPIEVLQLNRFKDELEVDQIIFIVFGGDRGRPEVTWETGLIAIGHISREPYDVGYQGRNFKLEINVDILLERNIKKGDLIPYRSTYNLPGISPMTKGEPNQALSAIYGKQAVGLVRAILDKYPNLEDRLTDIFGENFMLNVKDVITYLVEEDKSFEERQRQDDETNEDEDEDNEVGTQTTYSNLYNPDIDRVIGSFEMEIGPIEHLKNYINIGKNIILTGPPGTGKTTIAERVADEGIITNYIDGYVLSTATDDWSTFDTLGGYMPDPNDSGKLRFHEGIVLKSIRQNKWLIIDELNRADIDKAFGQLFTILSGKNVELPFENEGNSVKIIHYIGANSYFDPSSSTYYIGQNWRVIGTMNTFDKNSLFTFSYAFMRRFAFIEIPIPNFIYYSNLIDVNDVISQINKDFLKKLVEVTPRPLGPAIILELIDYIEITNNSSKIEAICGTVIPQYEGLDHNYIIELYQQIGSYLTSEEKDTFKSFVGDFFELPNNFFRSADRRLLQEDIALQHEFEGEEDSDDTESE